MNKKIEYVRKLKSKKKYDLCSGKFLEARNAYLEKLKNRDDICGPEFDGLLDIVLNPCDEFELEYCQSILRFQDDVKDIRLSCIAGDIKKINLDESYAIRTISDCIKSMSVYEVKPEVYEMIKAVDSSRLTYEILVLSGCDKDEFFERLVSECNLNSGKLEDLELFNFYYSLFFAFLNSISTTRVMNEISLDGILSEEINQANRFHELYLNGLSSNCTFEETYKGSNFQKSLK